MLKKKRFHFNMIIYLLFTIGTYSGSGHKQTAGERAPEKESRGMIWRLLE